jgi:hypothetical protein
VSNPVAPPPPANEGFGAAPSGQPQQGFGDAPAALPAEPKKKSGAGRVILRIVLALVVGIGVFVVKQVVFGDKAKDAAVGDCISSSQEVKDEETDASAEVVDCTSSKAAFTVIGRVNGEKDTSSKSCDQYFTKDGVEYAIFANQTGSGYLLCLEPKKS